MPRTSVSEPENHREGGRCRKLDREQRQAHRKTPSEALKSGRVEQRNNECWTVRQIANALRAPGRARRVGSTSGGLRRLLKLAQITLVDRAGCRWREEGRTGRGDGLEGCVESGRRTIDSETQNDGCPVCPRKTAKSCVTLPATSCCCFCCSHCTALDSLPLLPSLSLLWSAFDMDFFLPFMFCNCSTLLPLLRHERIDVRDQKSLLCLAHWLTVTLPWYILEKPYSLFFSLYLRPAFFSILR